MVRQIVFKLFLPGRREPLVRRFHAPPGHHYSPDNIERAIEESIEKLDFDYAQFNFRMVRVGAGAVNFIYDGERRAAQG